MACTLWCFCKFILLLALCSTRLLPANDITHRTYPGSRYLAPHTSVYQRPNIFSQTPGRRPAHITGYSVNSVTLGRIGAPNERAPFRFRDAIAVYCRSMSDEDSDRRPGFGGASKKMCGLRPRNFTPRELSREADYYRSRNRKQIRFSPLWC